MGKYYDEDYEDEFFGAVKAKGKKNNKGNKSKINNKVDYMDEKPVKKEKSITRKIILNVSTINEPEVNMYYDANFECNGLISLESITKYVIYKLAEEVKTVDEIIMVASKFARDKRTKDPLWNNANSIEVFQDRIKGYLGENSEQNQRYEDYIQANNKDKDGNVFICDESSNTKKLKKRYKDCMPKFTVIDFEDGKDIEELLKLKNAILSDVNDGLELYVDTKGGNRNWIFQFDAIIGMIKDKIIKLERYETDYARGKPVPKHQFVDARKYYEMHELLNAYNLLTNYGIGDGLYEFFKNNDDVDPEIVKLAGLFKNAMESIAICKIDKLIEKLNNIENFKSDKKDIIEKSRFRLIIDELYMDTKGMLDHDPMDRFIAIIEWCKNKKMYAQAINIIESSLMKYLPILNFEDQADVGINGTFITIKKGGDLKELDDLSYQEYSSLVEEIANRSELSGIEYLMRQATQAISNRVCRHKYRQKNGFEEVYIANDLTDNSEEKMGLDEFLSYKFDEYTTIEDIESYFLREFSFSISGKGDFYGTFKIPAGENIYEYSYTIPGDKKKSFIMISYLYQYIKMKRNHIDHVNTDKIVDDSVELKSAIELLIEELRKLKRILIRN